MFPEVLRLLINTKKWLIVCEVFLNIPEMKACRAKLKRKKDS